MEQYLKDLNLLLQTIDSNRREIDIMTSSDCVIAIKRLEKTIKELESANKDLQAKLTELETKKDK